MAGLDEIAKGLRGEIQSLLIRISPTERGSNGFVPSNPETHGSIEEQTAVARTFWLEPLKIEKSWMGNSVRRYHIDWQLRIGYPAHGWEICAIADYDSITASVNMSGAASTVSGVGFRYVVPDGLAFERTANWLWTTITIASVVEAS